MNHSIYTDDFRVFFEAYPKREGGNPRRTAELAFLRARKRASMEDIMAGLLRYNLYLTSKDMIGSRFVAQAATWLNRDGWADEYTIAEPSEEQRERDFVRELERLRDERL